MNLKVGEKLIVRDPFFNGVTAVGEISRINESTKQVYCKLVNGFIKVSTFDELHQVNTVENRKKHKIS